MADDGVLEVTQTIDPDGCARLHLKGEFDYVSSGRLVERLDELKQSGGRIRLDLSELDFIDSGGVRTVLRSIRDAESDGRRLEIDPQLSWQVKQVFDVLGLDAVLWPPADSAQ